MEKFKDLQLNIRKNILFLSNWSNEGHVPSSFSIVEIIISIFSYSLDINPNIDFRSIMKNLVLSKGHASFALYSVMYEYGILGKNIFQNICKNGSPFFGHIPYKPFYGLNFGTGSLGHGLPYAIGKAYGNLLKGINDIVYCIIGDGEANEGTFWESLLLLRKFNQINIIIIIDNNQSSDRAIIINDILNNIDKFSINFKKVDGHDIVAIMNEFKNKTEGPLILLANTQKGQPLNCMINNPVWHHKSPTELELNNIFNELNLFYA